MLNHLLLTGTKADLKDRAVDRREIQRFANQNNIFYMETSAKSGDNVRKLFEEIGAQAEQLPIISVDKLPLAKRLPMRDVPEKESVLIGNKTGRFFSCCAQA